jgi:uncharacterized protein YceH (UPF0502 family)
LNDTFFFSAQQLKRDPLGRAGESQAKTEEGHMELLLLIPIVAITAFVTVKITRRRAARSDSQSPDVTARLEALERELAETQERLDFAERMLTQARAERRIGS